MPDFLNVQNVLAQGIQPEVVGIRLLMSLAGGGLVAVIYRRTRNEADIVPSFPGTLVLLAVLIAMVTQVIGDNVARAFSLVGALAIVRFRTVVRDTQDTAYVIFAVVVGMALGAGDIWVALLGLAVVAIGAFLMSRRSKTEPLTSANYTHLLHVRVGLGHDVDALVASAAEPGVVDSHLLSVSTAKQGMSVDATYEVRLSPAISPADLVAALNRLDGVQSVELQRRADEKD